MIISNCPCHVKGVWIRNEDISTWYIGIDDAKWYRDKMTVLDINKGDYVMC